MKRLSHVDSSGKARMVDVGEKPTQRRIARATGMITLSKEACRLVARNEFAKGDVLAVAQIAGIQAAKRTGELIPLCHPLVLDHVAVQLTLMRNSVRAVSEVRSLGRTGVEMEAMTAVSVALLTVYDMCKAVDKRMVIGAVRVLSKEKLDV
jgi:cyclic pyranopterin monophosphate synthase